MYPRDTELVHPTVTPFMMTDEFGYCVDDGEVCECGWVHFKCSLDMYVADSA